MIINKAAFQEKLSVSLFFLVKDIQLLYGRLTARLYPRKQIWPLASSSNTIEAQGNLDGFPLSQSNITTNTTACSKFSPLA